jgi:hypothetical protein
VHFPIEDRVKANCKVHGHVSQSDPLTVGSRGQHTHRAADQTPYQATHDDPLQLHNHAVIPAGLFLVYRASRRCPAWRANSIHRAYRAPNRQAPGEEIVIAMFVTFRDGNLWI